jgi:hypothetical protein
MTDVKASTFYSKCADLLAAGQFSASYFADVVMATNTLRRLSADAKQQEKGVKHECGGCEKCDCDEPAMGELP